MKTLLLDDGIFTMEDALEKTVFDKVFTEYAQLKALAKSEDRSNENTAIRFNRVYLDEMFLGRRAESTILTAMQKLLFNDSMYRKLADGRDFNYHLVRFSNMHETQLTMYTRNNEYGWHQDFTDDNKNWIHGRLVNYILYLTDDFKGGELQVSLQKETVGSSDYFVNWEIKPLVNKLVIMPCHLMHRVKPVISGTTDRVTINGHIGLKIGGN